MSPSRSGSPRPPSTVDSSPIPGSLRRAALPIGFALAAFLIYLLPGLLGEYGAFIDELYYVSCAERPALGYVDHPPLAMLLLTAWRAVLGPELIALRLPAALVGAVTVLGVGLLARRLGAGRFGQGLACGSMVAAPLFGVLFGYYSMNAYEVLIWLACSWILVEIEVRNRPQLWLAFGAIAGLGLLNKHTMVLFAVALAVGLVATPARRHLAHRWIWLGGALAFLVFLPNLIWQVAHDWPSLEFYRNAHMGKTLEAAPGPLLLLQVFFLNPGTLPVWAAGIVLLLRRRPPADLRHLGVLPLALLVIAIIGGENRPDRIAGIYPLLFAAGGAAWESIVSGQGLQGSWGERGVRSGRDMRGSRGMPGLQGSPGSRGMPGLQGSPGSRGMPGLQGSRGLRGLRGLRNLRAMQGLRIVLPFVLGATGVFLAPLGTPWLPPGRLLAFTDAIGFQVQIEQGAGKNSQLPQWFADRLAWEQLVNDVAAVRDTLTPDEREAVRYFAPSYGQAGALEWLGREAGLGPVYGAHNSWYLWGPPTDSVSVAIVLGNGPRGLSELFEEVELAGIHDCELCMPWRDQMPIWIVRRTRRPIAESWADWKHYE